MSNRSWKIGMFLAGLLPVVYPGSANSIDPWNSNVPVGDFGPPSPSEAKIVDDGQIVHDYRTAPQSHWTGTYEPISGQFCYIKKLVITEGAASNFKVRVWMVLDQVEGSPTFSEAPLETRAGAYRDANKNSMQDTVVASFKEAQFQPLIVINRGTPYLPGHLQKYQYVTYTCYLSNYRGNCYITGRLERRDDTMHDEAPAREPGAQ